ncbi:protein Dr1-like [Hydractinia symbiolongicarpus]|uniref:protein Dr1-like n=1 Tax=Hydractinia symbiolongicarpus TaxID=13093 RepID=UPI00254BF38C|nr:protein Dr1-like [Hydractinia symbiolongicarpus]
MADNAAPSQEDDLSLPRAAVNKMIKEMIPMIRVSNDARELVLNCCTEFIHLIASEANEICNKQTKKTISPEHVILALESLGFQDYIKDVEDVYQQFKKQNQTRKKNNKMKNQGVSEDELLRQQQALFAQARAEQAHEEWLHMQQQGLLQQQQQPGTTGMQPIATGFATPDVHALNPQALMQQPSISQPIASSQVSTQGALPPIAQSNIINSKSFEVKPPQPNTMNNTPAWGVSNAANTITHTNNIQQNTSGESGNT